MPSSPPTSPARASLFPGLNETEIPRLLPLVPPVLVSTKLIASEEWVNPSKLSEVTNVSSPGVARREHSLMRDNDLPRSSQHRAHHKAAGLCPSVLRLLQNPLSFTPDAFDSPTHQHIGADFHRDRPWSCTAR